MIDPLTLLAFSGVALGMVLSPGPNMMYLVSRSICQGREAGLISLGGVALGFVIWLGLTVAGVTALAMAVPFLYDVLRYAGAAYLLWLAWQAIRPGGKTVFEPQALAPDSPRRLFMMGLLTNLLNPKAAVLYAALLPQFIDPARGPVWAQGLALGVTQIVISVSVNALIVVFAARVARLFASRPSWIVLQRWVMASVLGALAVKLALEKRPA